MLFKQLSYGLTERGHEVLQDEFESEKDIEFSSRRILNIDDVIIPIITIDSYKKYFKN